MSAFSQLKQSDGTLVDFEPKAAPPPKRPRRWALSNWPVRWKVFAIVLVPLVLAGAFGGLRIYSSVTEATDLRRAADRTEMVPAIVDYMAALERRNVGEFHRRRSAGRAHRVRLQQAGTAAPVDRHRHRGRRQQGRHEHDRRRPGPDGQGHVQQHQPVRTRHHLCADPADRRGRHQRLGTRRRRTASRPRPSDCPGRSAPAAR